MTGVGARTRRWGIGLSLALLAVAFTPRMAITRPPAPDSCIQPNRRLTMYAEELPRTPDGKPRMGYGFSPSTASIPGPTIEMIEGDCLAITLINDVSAATLAELRNDPILGSRDPNHPLAVSLHVHGVKYLPSSDGTMHSDSYVEPGKTRTYTWFAAPRVLASGRVVSLGTAGYWWYHDHMVGTDHGTGGAASGLFGALIVRRATDVKPAHTYVVGFGPDTTINLRDFPDCPNPAAPVPGPTCFVAKVGELTEFVVIGFGDDFHTFHVHGHNWANTRNGLITNPADLDVPLLDNRTVGPADSFGFIVRAGEEVGAGNWMLHCHVQHHSDTGMSTFFHVIGADGTPVAPPVAHLQHAHG